MPQDMLIAFLTMLQVVGSIAWHLGLSTYEEHKERWEQLRAALAPHEALHALASFYAGKLNVGDRRHAEAIATLGQVFQLAGAMAAAYVPDATPIDKKKMH